MAQKKLVTLTGGSGGAMLLSGIRDEPVDIKAIVTMFDSGGSTGRLRDEFGFLPQGDVRQCILALAPENKQVLLRKLVSYRFSSEGDLDGHSVGNLILTALTAIKGSDLEAIKAFSRLFSIKGEVLPVSLDNAHIHAKLASGEVIEGETNIDLRTDYTYPIKGITLEPQAKLFIGAQQAIIEADMIVIGPGDLYTSLIPNLMTKGVLHAFNTTKAQILYISNLMTKPAETKDMDAAAHAQTILKEIGRDQFDAVLVNQTPYQKDLLKNYALSGQYPVEVSDNLKHFAKRVVSTGIVTQTDYIRHDAKKVGRAIMSLL